jgi:hypothetical protein
VHSAQWEPVLGAVPGGRSLNEGEGPGSYSRHKVRDSGFGIRDSDARMQTDRPASFPAHATEGVSIVSLDSIDCSRPGRTQLPPLLSAERTIEQTNERTNERMRGRASRHWRGPTPTPCQIRQVFIYYQAVRFLRAGTYPTHGTGLYCRTDTATDLVDRPSPAQPSRQTGMTTTGCCWLLLASLRQIK